MKSSLRHTNSILTLTAKSFGSIKSIPLLPIVIDEQLKFFTFIFRPRRYMKMQDLRNLIIDRLKLDTCYHRYGGIEFRHNGKEVAHMHSDGLLDIRFPKRLSSFLIQKGMTGLHHVYPNSGWTSVMIKGNANIECYFQLVCWKLALEKKEMDVDCIIDKVKNYHYEK